MVVWAGFESDSRCAAVSVIVGAWREYELPGVANNGLEDIDDQDMDRQ
jgi:hypothetical protein